MEEITHAFPRLNTLQRLHPNDNLNALIVDVFRSTICFCRDSITYFKKPSMDRVKQALKPNGLKVETISRLRVKLSQIHKECEIKMLEDLNDADLKLEAMHIHLEEIQQTGKDT